MATVIEELVSRLGFDIDDKKLKSFTNSSQKLKDTLKKISVVASAAAIGITAWVSKVAIATDANIKFADSVGISFDALQELQFATEREGGSLQSLQSSLLALSQRAGEAFRGMGEGVQVFGLLGVEVTDFNGELKTADVLLSDISDQFKNFSKTQQIEFAQKLGISPDLLLLMQKGSKNLNDLRLKARSFGLISEQTARNSEKFQDSLTDLKFTIRAVFTNIAGDLLPVVVGLADKLRDLFQKNKEIIKQKIAKSIKLIAVSIKLLVKNAKILLMIVGAIIALKVLTFTGSLAIGIYTVITALAGLNVSLTVTNVLMAGLPLIVGLAIAALVALVLVWDDLTEMQKKGGKESFFGNMAEGSEKARKRVELLMAVFNGLKFTLETILDVIIGINDFLWEVIDGLGEVGKSINEFIVDPIGKATKGLEKFKSILDLIKGQGLKTHPTIPNIPGPRTGESFFEYDERMKQQSNTANINELDKIVKGIGGLSSNIIRSIPNITEKNSPQISNATNINAPITIQSASGNPLEIGKAVETALNNIVRNGINNNPLIVVA